MRLKTPRLLPATIAAISALLMLKAVVLVQAIAGEATHQQPLAATPAADAPKPAPIAPATAPAAPPTAASPAPPPVSDSERAVLLALRARRDVLDTRARDLDRRQAELEAADRKLQERVGELAALQAKLENLEAGRQLHRSENWAGLVKTYEAMKPREAAAIFDALDMQVLLQVLDRMQERRAAAVLAAMQPDRARLATQLLAEMRTHATALPDQGAAGTPVSQPLPAPKG